MNLRRQKKHRPNFVELVVKPDPPSLRYDPRKEGLERWLGATSAEVMLVCWDAQRPLTVKAVQRLLRVDYGRELGYTSVMTTMSRLAEQGLLSRTPIGRSYHYTTIDVDAEAFERKRLRSIVKSLQIDVAQFVALLDDDEVN